jgi:hypothetical protein
MLHLNVRSFVSLFGDGRPLLRSREASADCLSFLVYLVLKEEKRDRRKGKKRRLEVEAERLHGQPVEQVIYLVTLI